METWATFSIVDHRKPVYRQALALFDKIIVPIPPKPIGDQTEEELHQLEAEDRPGAMAAAMRDFDTLTKKYAEAMEAAGYKKDVQVASIFFSFVTGEIIGAVKEGLVSAREIKEPCWKQVSEMKCAPGGVVYHFRQAFQ